LGFLAGQGLAFCPALSWLGFGLVVCGLGFAIAVTLVR